MPLRESEQKNIWISENTTTNFLGSIPGSSKLDERTRLKQPNE